MHPNDDSKEKLQEREYQTVSLFIFRNDSLQMYTRSAWKDIGSDKGDPCSKNGMLCPCIGFQKRFLKNKDGVHLNAEAQHRLAHILTKNLGNTYFPKLKKIPLDKARALDEVLNYHFIFVPVHGIYSTRTI